MTINYIGQELIWNLTGTNPYKKNNSHYKVSIQCQSQIDNLSARNFILTHLKQEQVYDVEQHGTRDFYDVPITDKIYIINAFDKISEVEFINNFVERAI